MLKNDDQYIKNFFLHLKEKDNKEIPVSIKFIYFPDYMTNMDIENFKYNINIVERANILNHITNHPFKFHIVGKFGDYSPNIALAYSNLGQVFINVNGEKCIDNFNILTSERKSITDKPTAAYLNTIQNNFMFNNVLYDSNNNLFSHITTYIFTNNKNEKKVIEYCNPICVDLNGNLRIIFKPKTGFEQALKNNTTEFLSKIETFLSKQNDNE